MIHNHNTSPIPCHFVLLCTFFAWLLFPTFSRAQVRIDSMELYDSVRQRKIPLMCYYQENTKQKQPLVMISHGYNRNLPGSYKGYSYFAEQLALQGFFVVSIQHELPTDDTIPALGIPQIVRRPHWERGAQNILFTLNELKKLKPSLDYRKVSLIGHSNGGDMSMLFAHNYPHLIRKVISFDNRRMAFPLTRKPRVYSLRSSDMPADEGVIPSPAIQKKYKMKVVYLPNTKHNDMCNNANDAQRKEIQAYLLRFLKD